MWGPFADAEPGETRTEVGSQAWREHSFVSGREGTLNAPHPAGVPVVVGLPPSFDTNRIGEIR